MNIKPRSLLAKEKKKHILFLKVKKLSKTSKKTLTYNKTLISYSNDSNIIL